MVGAKLNAIRGKLRAVWPYLAALVFLLVAGVAALIWLPEMQVPKEAYWLDTKTIFDIKNEARRTISYIIGGILALIGIGLTFWRHWIALEGQITERFTRAIDQLGSDKMEIRMGGIYALERIAFDSKKDYWPIIETLTAFVREGARWQGPLTVSPESLSREDPDSLKEVNSDLPESEINPSTDIQAALTVLGRRKYRFGHKIEIWRLDLRNTDLRGANLSRAHLEGAILRKAHLEGARLEGACLKKAYLEDAHLEGTRLRKAHLEGANLRRATGLTREQLAEAITDEQIKLPDYVKNKPPKVKG